MRAILFDLDGVLYQDNALIPGAAEVVAWVREKGIPHLFLTNTTSRPRSAIVAKLSAMGVAVTEDEVLTPPLAAVRWLRDQGVERIALFVAEATKSEFAPFRQSDSAEEVQAVVVGDLGEGWDFAILNHLFRLLMHEPAPPLVALGLTRYWRSEGGLRLDLGPFVKALEYATGHDAVVLGKPAGEFYQAALATIGVSAEQVVMIGDDIRGDIAAAQHVGMNALLVRTGKFRPADLTMGIQPTAVLDSIADLPSWWRDYSPPGASPDQAL